MLLLLKIRKVKECVYSSLAPFFLKKCFIAEFLCFVTPPVAYSVIPQEMKYF